MKKHMMIYLMFVLMGGFKTLAQLPSIAIAKPHVENLEFSQDVLARLTQLEYIKTESYRVYDEFDLQEVIENDQQFKEQCFGKNCLLELGKKLNVDYVIGGSFTKVEDKIIISMKLLDTKKGIVSKNKVQEFIYDTKEINRMIRVMVAQMQDKEVSGEIISQLKYDEGSVVKSPVGMINNSGTRVGYSFFSGDLRDYAKRPRSEGGLDIYPGASMIGYQWEKQYIGTDKFSSLIEILGTVSGLEQGTFIPSLTLMNGFRFGKQGWEFAFGPGFGIKTVSNGVIDHHGHYGTAGKYWTEGELWENDLTVHPDYEVKEFLDRRSSTFKLSTRWVMAVGRTFKAGGLNIPVNIFYSSFRNSGMLGMSVGFNVVKD